MDAFFAWDVHLRSLVPAILADTLLSVDFCHQKQGKTLRCCSTLLYVWGITHFYASSHMGTLPNPLRSFSKIPLHRCYAMEWKAEIEHWSIDHISWICPWFRPDDILIRCGDYPNEMHAIYRAWEKPVFVGDRELDRELQEKVDALTKKLEIMGAQLKALENKNEESSLIIDGLQRQCKKKDQEIERLKDECANINEKTIHATKMQKTDLDSQLREISAKIAYLEAEHAKQA
ncbi:hypothetical protein Fmac_032634 [Flemingia macrophylla]|uniref:DUF7745 domain-containing protein n=1 Tax=Flemingia macrophylla TaxID=520843 RepID=A0ABD1L5W8_9FABA